MVYAVVVAVVVLATMHLIVGLVSVSVGVSSSIRAEVWLAHTVSPIWSGAFFIITGLLGFACAKRKTAYMIMCFTAFSIVSLVTAIVSIQLLRLGLVNHTTDGNTYQKEEKDVMILVALADAGFEILICLVSSIVSCRMARAAKKELFQKRAGCFHVQDGDEQTAESNFEESPIKGANQNGEVFIPTDGRHTPACPTNGHANPAANHVWNSEIHERQVEIHVQDENGGEISPRIDHLGREFPIRGTTMSEVGL